MDHRLRLRVRLTVSTVLTFTLLTSHYLLADNRLSLKTAPGNLIVVELSNTDPVAGIQFSLNARGGIALRDFAGDGRVNEGGWQIFQYLKDDSTLNVVMLAPFRSSLTAGQGAIGKVSFALNRIGPTDTVRLFFTRTEICDAEARVLQVTALQLSLNIRESIKGPSDFFRLGQNFPNPFNPSTTITYELARPARVRLAIFDITGREVRTLVNQLQTEGRYAVRWSAEDVGGSRLPSGTYIARLQVDDQVAIKKMLLTK